MNVSANIGKVVLIARSWSNSLLLPSVVNSDTVVNSLPKATNTRDYNSSFRSGIRQYSASAETRQKICVRPLVLKEQTKSDSWPRVLAAIL